jgi:hypothetical protein
MGMMWEVGEMEGCTMEGSEGTETLRPSEFDDQNGDGMEIHDGLEGHEGRKFRFTCGLRMLIFAICFAMMQCILSIQ